MKHSVIPPAIPDNVAETTMSWLRRLACLASFLIGLMVLGACRADDAKLAASFSHPHDCQLDVREGVLHIEGTGDDIYFLIDNVPAHSGSVRLEFSLRSTASGQGQLFWSTMNEQRLLEKSSVKFEITHNDCWGEYRIPFTATEALRGLRFDAGRGPGTIYLAGLRLVDTDGLILKHWLPLRDATLSGEAVIEGGEGDDRIRIVTTSRLAGAIHSLTWRGQEFIDSVDHGRQLQSACSFGDGGPFHAECFNPTEAGSRRDAAGTRTSSRLLFLQQRDSALRTLTQMAFWLAPGELSEGKPAINRELVSEHLLAKHVHIGFRDLPRVIQYEVTFQTSIAERHKYAQFESLTGYMPPVFDHFWKYDVATSRWEPLSRTSGEQPFPVALSTANGQYAMAIYSPGPRDPRFGKPSYGRFSFEHDRVTKWNCVYRLREPAGIAPGHFTFNHFVVIGDLASTADTLRKLHALAEQEDLRQFRD